MSDKRPKQVLLFQEDEKALGYQYEIPRTLSMRDIDVKSIDYDVEEVNKNFTLVGAQPTENSVYYLHPYKKNTYVHESLGEDYFLKEKLALYIKVGYLIGAKTIVTKVISSESKKREIDANGECRYKVIEGDLNINHTTTESYKKSLEISKTFEHKDNFDLDKNIDKLRKMIDMFNLHHETNMISMIDARDSRNSGTILKTEHVKSEITSEYNKILDISAKLSNPVFSVSAGFKDNLEIINKIKVDIRFEF